MMGRNASPTQSGLRTQQSDSEPDDVKIVGRDTWRYNPNSRRCNATMQGDTRPRYKVIHGHNTDTRQLMDLPNSYQATMNNMGMEHGRMRKEPDDQSSGKATAKTARKTVAAASTFRLGNEDPYDIDSDPGYHFPHFEQDRLEARLDNPCAAPTVEHFDPLWSPGTIPYLPDMVNSRPWWHGWSTAEEVQIDRQRGQCSGHLDICNSLQRRSMQQRVRDTLRRDGGCGTAATS